MELLQEEELKRGNLIELLVTGGIFGLMSGDMMFAEALQLPAFPT